MKRLNSPKDDNVPIYIFALLFMILFLSFLGTYFDTSKSRPLKSTAGTEESSRLNRNGWNMLDALPDSHHTVQYLPGHIHAFYLEYVYYSQRNGATGRAPGVYSDRIQRGSQRETTYGTIHN
ncbi:hypothetical protein ETB97_004038 [Aspergillus alliaceus]|uniref:Uncharacterized protein n=1 Tax=Petromyces alliaceus TaxID=209559 RepID=A0A8H6AHM2_PETAA|nr:hypothetical protein ETB97_004038 [Aspergillus burnettii]